jgi:HAD superfamily hydrolase (TIGR01484 family)
MRYLALACDYDGTLATEGRVGPDVLAALQGVRESGRKLILVTGRRLEELRQVFPEYAIFDRIVAENGALLFTPETRDERMLGDPASEALVQHLHAANVAPLAVGRVIIATWEPHETVVLEAIRELGLELQVIFNKGAVMVLPSGINKATGLRVALQDLLLSPHNTVGVGDAENDHALLAECELGVAVDNALPALKERADWTTRSARGAGVTELIRSLLDSDLRELVPRLSRWDLQLGNTGSAEPVTLHPWGRRLLLCGTSGSGKSTLATSFLEALSAKRYQYCLVDPEGDYDALPGAIVVGNEQHAPDLKEVLEPLRTVKNDVVANLLAVPFDRRAPFLSALLARLDESRTRWGRPHFVVVDEAHHMIPERSVEVPEPVAHLPLNLLLITVHADRLADTVLQQVDGLIVVGADPQGMMGSFAAAVQRPVPSLTGPALQQGEAWFWSLTTGTCVRFAITPPKAARHRHRRKYAAGELGEDKSFYFRGPDAELNLRAQNLAMFLQIADGVDDSTWQHHLSQHDYSGWLRDAIKNDELAAEVERIETSVSASPRESRQQIRAAIERVYTLSA